MSVSGFICGIREVRSVQSPKKEQDGVASRAQGVRMHSDSFGSGDVSFLRG